MTEYAPTSKIYKIMNLHTGKVKEIHVLNFDEHEKADKHQTVREDMPAADDQELLVYMTAYCGSLLRASLPETMTNQEDAETCVRNQ